MIKNEVALENNNNICFVYVPEFLTIPNARFDNYPRPAFRLSLQNQGTGGLVNNKRISSVKGAEKEGETRGRGSC